MRGHKSEQDKQREKLGVQMLGLVMLAVCAVCTALILLSGCSEDGRETFTKRVGNSGECIDGVVYYLSYQHMAVAMNPDGTIKTCNGE